MTWFNSGNKLGKKAEEKTESRIEAGKNRNKYKP